MTPWAKFDTAKPGLLLPDGLAGRTMYQGLNGDKFDIGYNDANFTANGWLGCCSCIT